jgi:hypothetical protein
LIRLPSFFNAIEQKATRLFKAVVPLAAICCLIGPPAFAQGYPISGVWVAADDHTAGSKGGACFTLKLLGIDSVMDGSLPPVLIFADGKRVEARVGYHSEKSIKSVKNVTDDVFRIAELPAKRSGWIPWSRRQFRFLRVVDPNTIEFGDGTETTRFVKCSRNSFL